MQGKRGKGIAALFAITALVGSIAYYYQQSMEHRSDVGTQSQSVSELSNPRLISSIDPSLAAQTRSNAPVFSGNAEKNIAEGSAAPTKPAVSANKQPDVSKKVFRDMYSDLLRELKLSDEDGDRLIELLVDSQAKISRSHSSGGNAIALAPLAFEQSKHSAEDVASFLGAEKYAQYQEYQKTIGEHISLRRLRIQLTAKELPLLSEAQEKSLLTIFKEEKAKSIATGTNTSMQVASRGTQAETYNDRVLQRAKAIMTAEQLATFGDGQAKNESVQISGAAIPPNTFGLR